MTPERRAEAQQAGSAFHLALIYIGIASIDEAFELWAQLPESQAPAAVESWIRSMQTMTQAHRRESRELAMSYYRLARALHTGRTVVNPWEPDTDPVTLGTLRSEFADLVEDAQRYRPRSVRGREILSGDESEEPDSSGADDDAELVEVDEINQNIRTVQQRDDDDADDIQRSILLVNLNDYRAKQERARSEEEARKAQESAALLAAATAQKGSVDGGRGTLQSVERRDKEAIGFVRVSRTGTPCGFCAMLISRGIALKYKTEGAATFRSDGEKYHLNCQCYGEPVFSTAQYNSDPRFDLNRRYSKEWPKVTKGLSGRDAQNAWRRWIERGQYRNRPTSTESSAPAA